MLLMRKRSSKVKNSQNIPMTAPPCRRPLGFGPAGQMQEKDVLQLRRHRTEIRAGGGRSEDADLVLPAGPMSAHDVQFPLEGTEVLLGGDDCGTHLPGQRPQGLR